MTKHDDVHARRFASNAEDAELAAQGPTDHPSYRLAYQDLDFLKREDMRAFRLQLELLKPELLQQEHGIESTFVVYGSARIPEASAAAAMIANAKTPVERRKAEKLAEKAKYYEEARKLAQTVSLLPQTEDGKRNFVIVSGGGPSIMEAANRGAHDVGKESIALNIVLPFEQAPNQYVTPELSFLFHYFAIRKMHFLIRARAVAAFPGGFGTLDELFETLCLIQTGKIKRMPVLLYGRAFWERVIDFEALVDEGTVSPGDLDLFHYVETAAEGWKIVADFYGIEDGASV
ncbi:LOG family protein [Pacificimonas sp. WHA3]|uniref:AMP nucleosidase n=1 Tax=Pacificimonas pallii TaxID=2827236 RepID=A0ABS6SFR3_9SPHN|nr:LOG family protein [Pacificimonas pallii]MBV7257258.1 LOG family protein [Pacificimonas pallii]